MPVRHGLLGLALLWATLCAAQARAIPIIQFEFLGSGQVFSPTDAVAMRGRVTNVSADESLTSAVQSGGFINLSGLAIFDNYVERFPPGFQLAPPGVVNLAPGASLDWTIATWDPWPITGSPGDPVEPGTYVLPLDNFQVGFFVAAGQDSFSVIAREDNASAFEWRVQRPAGVAAPGAAWLILSGLLALSVRRKNR